MNANAEKKVITVTYTQKQTEMGTCEDGKKGGFYSFRERDSNGFFLFFRKNDGFCPFPCCLKKWKIGASGDVMFTREGVCAGNAVCTAAPNLKRVAPMCTLFG